MKISMIVAISANNVIGGDNKLLWHLPNDLKRFKEITLNHYILLGRKTFESLPYVLPNRKHLVISNQDMTNVENVWYFKSIESAINFVKDEEIIICGGGEIYKQTMNLATKLYITRIDTQVNGDTYFKLEGDWKLQETESYSKDNKNNYDYTFETYVKRTLK